MDLRGQGDPAKYLPSTSGQRGYAMAALLVGLSVMAVLMGMALPVWTQYVQREKEQELIWRGQQYARAVGLFMRKYANTYPPTVDILIEQKFLRKKYKDPITNDDFQLVPAGQAGAAGVQLGTAGGAMQAGRMTMTVGRGDQADGRGGFSLRGSVQGQAPGGRGGAQLAGGIAGVVSKSSESSIKIYNGRSRYNEWAFTYIQTTQAIAPPGGVQPGGQPGPFGQPGGRSGFPGMGPGGRGPFDPNNPGSGPFSPGGPPIGGRGRGPFGGGNPPPPGGFGAPPPFGPNPFQPQPPGGQPPKKPPL